MLGPIFQCYNCDIIFTQFNHSYYIGQVEEICPNPDCAAQRMDIAPILEQTVSIEFHAIIGESFNEVRRMNLRCIAEEAMPPYNPLTRGL
jgi:hypothetical protein